jgi:hypothetical protein
MNNLIIRKFLIILFLLSLTFTQGNAQIFHKNPEKKLFGKTVGNKKQVKVSEPRSVSRAKRKQEANKKKLDKEYKKSVQKSRERAYDIQTPEVQDRMKQDQKNLADRDKTKKKRVKKSTKKAGKKYL